jgi:RNA polymerase sigma-70 factor (ECF subfamily)
MATVDEKDLILLLRNSDVKAFDLLFLRYYKKVMRFCQNITGSKEDAEEITQIVFQAVWENRTVIDAGKPFETYLFAITRHQVCNSLKRKAFRRVFFERLDNPSFICETEAESGIYFNDLNQLLQKLIDTLPAKRKEIFLLSRKEGLTYKQIAQALNITENTVDTQIRNALNYLRPILKSWL